MNNEIFQGELIRLASVDTEKFSASYSRWMQDTEFQRLFNGDPSVLYTKKHAQEFLEKIIPEHYFFGIHTLVDDKLIGELVLDGVEWVAGNTWLGIGLGEREYWSKGYGTDAMKVAVRFAFRELNLHRVSLDVSEYNPRAIHCYEKAGFRHEGRARGMLKRDGRRWDLIYMSILRGEWEGNCGLID